MDPISLGPPTYRLPEYEKWYEKKPVDQGVKICTINPERVVNNVGLGSMQDIVSSLKKNGFDYVYSKSRDELEIYVPEEKTGKFRDEIIPLIMVARETQGHRMKSSFNKSTRICTIEGASHDYDLSVS